jgi:HEAT repeat protein
MARFLLLLCALAIGGIATVIYLDAAHFDTRNATVMQVDGAMAITPAEIISALDDSDRQKQATVFEQNGKLPTSATSVVTAQKITATQIARWITQTNDEDPAIRAKAIDALANAPKTKAVPVLLNVMRAGDDNDRQLAVDSLHTLALQQGDEDDGIRTALRLVIYDGEEEAMISNAQIALEDIEYDIAPSPAIAKPGAKADQR